MSFTWRVSVLSIACLELPGEASDTVEVLLPFQHAYKNTSKTRALRIPNDRRQAISTALCPGARAYDVETWRQL